MGYSKCQQCDDKYPECEKTCTEYLEHVAKCKEIEKNRREYYKEHARMMTETQKKMMEELGLTEEDFEPKPSEEERIKELEAALEVLLSGGTE